MEYTGHAEDAQLAQQAERTKEEAAKALSELRFARIEAGDTATYPWLLETVEGIEELLRSVPSRHRFEVLTEAGAAETGEAGAAWLAFAGAEGRELGVASDPKGALYAGVMQPGGLVLHGTPARAVSHLITGRIPQEPAREPRQGTPRRYEETPRGHAAPGKAEEPHALKDRVAAVLGAKVGARLLALGGVSEEETLLTALAAGGVGRAVVREVVEDLRRSGNLLRLRTPRGNVFLALGSPDESEGARELVARAAKQAVVRAEALLLRDEAACRGARRGKTFAAEAAGDRPNDDVPQPSVEAAAEKAFAEFRAAKARAEARAGGDRREPLSARAAASAVLTELRYGNAATVDDLTRLIGDGRAAAELAARLEEKGYVRLSRAGRHVYLRLAGEFRERTYRPEPKAPARPARPERKPSPREAERIAWDTAEAVYASRLPSAAHRILYGLRCCGGWLALREVLDRVADSYAEENPYGDLEKGLRSEIRNLKEAGKVRVARNRRDGRDYLKATEALDEKRHEGELLAIIADPRHGISVPPGTKLARRVAGMRHALDERRARREELQSELAPAA